MHSLFTPIQTCKAHKANVVTHIIIIAARLGKPTCSPSDLVQGVMFSGVRIEPKLDSKLCQMSLRSSWWQSSQCQTGVALQAVIGAGAAGLAAARELVSEGHKVTVFEKGSGTGGVWVYTDQVESPDLLGKLHLLQNQLLVTPRRLTENNSGNCSTEMMGLFRKAVEFVDSNLG